ncbi:MAG: hypothetical protein JG777_633 [Clostridia bacterium]|jgi:uncharacterized beta-barrel protein YwiB (DUF1934 family)|uniref:DUF1934 domain-containing protein n=1 Tax=Petroclostridium xylanilyticum TaxID=1792311 RepID=UPI000B97E565|nr:DUF1934 domain-containing protein [Petroclostridium xylanilyticum]MBZ4645144.1 hypothetical protein [Clostridia bacterium]
MHKNVIISVKGTQHYNDDKDSIELVTEGKYYKKGNSYYVTYKETEITGMEGTTTTLKIGDGKVTLMRFGQNNSQLIFEKGQKHLCYYETAYGGFTVGVFSNNVDINIDDNGGEISVDYLLQIDNMKAGENDFYLQIREANLTNDQFNRNSKKPN